MEFKSWKDIRDWADKHGFKNIVKRMNINNDCWSSSGEFGRSQVNICDSIRFAKDEEERINIATEIEAVLEKDFITTGHLGE